VAEPFDVELAVRPPELHEVQAGEVACRIVEENVLGAIVDDESVGDEVLGRLLREIEHLLVAERFDALHRVGEDVLVNGETTVHFAEGFRLGARGIESDLALEERPRTAADPEQVHLPDRVRPRSAAAVGKDGLRGAAATIAVQLGLDSEREKKQLDLGEQLARRGVE
jgi:hypothetical protein